MNFKRLQKPCFVAGALVPLVCLGCLPLSHTWPVLRFHGTLDRILPIGNQTVDVRIEGGGHLISLTHSEVINARMAEWLVES